jgi:ParB/RepB/Spo0J family partition protein
VTLRVQEIPAAAIVPSPHNPRQLRDGDPGIASLAESIKAQGLIQPITVRHRLDSEGDRYEIVAGERRWRACRVAGLEAVPAIVRTDLDDQQALELIVTENLQREDLHPLEEAHGVASLLCSGHTSADVADRLGKSLGWVARRARLAKLSDTWRKLVGSKKSPVSEWTAEMLELVARLEPKAQAEFYQAKQHAIANRLIDLHDLRGWLADWTRELRLAPWAQDDATLDPQAGACSTCPKRSSCNPGLFDDDETDRKKSGPGDRCLDATCWSRKLERHLARVVEDLRAKHGEVRFAGWFPHGSKLPAFVGEARLVEEWTGEKVKAGTPGAVPVLEISGESIGKLTWKKFRQTDSKGAAAKKSGKPKAASLAERREKLEARRRAFALEAICEAVVKSAPPDLHNLVALVAAFGTDFQADRPGPAYDRGGQSIVPLKVFSGSNHEARLWTLVSRVLVRRWRNALSWGGQKGLAAHQPEIGAVARVLGLDLAPFEVKAAEAIPEPKSWAAEVVKAKPAKNAGGKRKAA